MTRSRFTLLLFTALLSLWTSADWNRAVRAALRPTAGPQRLKKIIYADGSVRQFTYDGAGKLIQELYSHRTNRQLSQVRHTYGRNGKMAGYSLQYDKSETPWNQGYEEEYLYNEAGRLTGKKRYVLRQGAPAAPVKTLAYLDSLTYNSIGQVIRCHTYSYAVKTTQFSQTPVTLTTADYRYNAQGNLVEEIATTAALQQWASASTRMKKVEYEYDDKTNPFYLPECPIFDQASWSKNNLVRTKTYLTTGNRQELEFVKPIVSAYRYVYENDLPVRRFWESSSSVLEQYEYE